MSFEITDKGALWKTIHSQGRCGGPRKLSIGGSTVFENFAFRVGEQTDDMLHSKKAHVYHKAGQTIFESDGVFSGKQTLHQICRYAGNAMRVTWDLGWPKNTALVGTIEAGSMRLQGTWKRYFVLTKDNFGKPAAWQVLEAGQHLRFEGMLLSIVLERIDGVRLEFSLGFDIWRWEYALGVGGAEMLLDVDDDGVTFSNILAKGFPKKDDDDPGTVPEGREYRFTAVLAWSFPGMPQAPGMGRANELSFGDDAKKGLLLPNGKGRNFCVDFAKLPCIDNARRVAADGSKTLPCLSDAYALTAMKRIIRQLAELTDNGKLKLVNLHPGLCCDGSHVAKKGERIHWDHTEILNFLAWTKNCLGDGWTVLVPQTGVFAELPSLEGLYLPNGFCLE